MQIAVGRGDDSHADRYGFGTAGAMNLVLLQHSQKLDLQPHRHVADFIEQQSTAFGGFEQAFLRARRAVERTFFVSEQFGFEKILCHCAAVDGDEGFVAPRAGVVNGMRQEFLAGSTLAGEQYAGVGTRDHVRLREPVLHQLVSGDDIGAPILIDVRESGHLERLLHMVQQVLLIDGFGQKNRMRRFASHARHRESCRAP